MQFYLTGVSVVSVLELGGTHIGEWVSVEGGQVRVGAKSKCEWVEPAEMEIVRKRLRARERSAQPALPSRGDSIVKGAWEHREAKRPCDRPVARDCDRTERLLPP